jgi:hypothetical protein
MPKSNVSGLFAVGLLVVLAGCSGGLLGSGPLSFSAEPVHVANGTLDSTEYALVTDESITFERSFEVQGQSKEVVMNAHMVQLERSYQGAPLGSVVFLSMPQIKILGQQIDVIGRMDTTSLIEQAQGQSGDLQTDQKVDELSMSILGGQRTVEVFRGTSSQSGEEAKVRIYVTTFDHEGDTIVGVAVVPQQVDGQQQSIRTLFGGLQYGS